MGDTGSNLLGYLMAVITVQGALKTNAVVALFFPLAILAVPILDTSFVVAKRLKYGRAIYRADMSTFITGWRGSVSHPGRTIAYLYGWTLVLAGVALALRFVPYSDNHGHFRTGWTIFMAACLIGALVASIYVIQVLEILKMKGFRRRQVATARPAADSEVEEGVLHSSTPAPSPPWIQRLAR